jgi:GGDEF domain-containing protein
MVAAIIILLVPFILGTVVGFMVCRYTSRRAIRNAHQDLLTGLPDRTVAWKSLENAERRGRPTTVCVADVNKLKQTNDIYGHEAGDVLIESVANALRDHMLGLPGSIIARVGGDEFLILTEAAPSDVEQEFKVAGISAVAVGVTVMYPGEDPGDAVARADKAMYAAKNDGEPVEVYTLSMGPVERRKGDRRKGDRRK